MELRDGMCRMEDGSLKPTGLREFMCFLYRYLSSCYEGDKENALKSTLDFDKQFKIPLMESEIIRATKSAEKAYKQWLNDCPSGTYSRGGYNYKNKTLIKLLNITDEEMKNLETIIDNKEVKRRNKDGLIAKQQELRKEKEKVLELRVLNLTIRDISKTLGISKSKVGRLLK